MRHKIKINTLFTSDTDMFKVGESSLDYFVDRPQRLESGVILLCLSGEAEMTANMHNCLLTKNTEVIIIPQEICMITRKSDDFRVMYFAFSSKLFHEASFRISSDYFGFLKENMYVLLDENDLQSNVAYLKLVEGLYLDKENLFRETIVTNYLQNYLLNSCDKIHRYNSQVDIREADRQNNIFKRFIQLLYKHCTDVREVNFFANELSISTRYLSTIIRRCSQMSAKEFIDNCVIQEIKLHLHSSDLSIQEIARQLNFPDQSYMGRFFKKKTGLSPTEYRKGG